MDWDGVQGQNYKVNAHEFRLCTLGLILDYYNNVLRCEN